MELSLEQEIDRVIAIAKHLKVDPTDQYDYAQEQAKRIVRIYVRKQMETINK